MADPPPRSPARHPELRRPSSGGSLNGAPPRGPPTPTSGGREDPRRNGERAPRRGSSARNPQRLPDATVVLNIYDVVEHPFAYSIGKWMTLGIHHTGIQVGMREFAFTLEGIVITEPHRIPRCKLTHRILLTRNATDAMVQGALTKLQREFTPATYDPLLKNCNHFSDAFCARIGTKHVPRWVNRAPTMASMLGTRFRLRPAKVTAPPVAWSVMIPDGEAAAKGLASNPLPRAPPGALMNGLINGMYSSQKKKELVEASTIVAFDSGL
ncbi:hypothetical protein AURANDRAFT_65816 [Aureococcus anophagefferens]|uniref:PPPDE domain-containing protein n=1 Tax=Aureococcus anophagefferens TaxID=44056 RepID=F0YFK9_AURAN|nr:hypothetical protein AURANDRAFT_65816 [Aureococcus anophagefferens]EGB06122.1 hypothetical protein AURANDRAFT_65816 [Aureococcus anophagefferens]|eukprot:XP_009039078.1 hypothetical protein AURANDRAFT_65816 [Aureococcus anophagefferens]